MIVAIGNGTGPVADWPHPPSTLPAAGTSLAAQDRHQLGGRLSILSRQKADHVALNRMLEQLAKLPDARRDALLRRIDRLVFPHAFAEEAVLWPVIRRVLPDGPALTLRIEQEHQEINELVTRLEDLPPGSVAHRQTLDRIVLLLREDVRDEEDALLPRLQMYLSVTQLRLLGLAWEAVRRIAPTRPHPVVSRRPPGNILSALPLSVLDRSRDGVDRLIQHGGWPARPLEAISRALTGMAHGLEEMPGLRRGEDPSTRIARRPDRQGRWGLLAVAALSVAGVVAYRRSGLARLRA